MLIKIIEKIEIFVKKFKKRRKKTEKTEKIGGYWVIGLSGNEDQDSKVSGILDSGFFILVDFFLVFLVPLRGHL
jgi:hypothetical protein